jgi:hypothetical protein
MRWMLVLLVIAGGMLAAALALFVLRRDDPRPISLPQDPMPGRLLVGLQDDPGFRWASDRSEMLDRGRDASVSLLRTVVSWRDAAPTRPAEPADPFDPAYRLDDIDDLVRSSQQRGIELLITIWGTPEWANGGQPPNHPPSDSGELESFAAALADRSRVVTPAIPRCVCSRPGTNRIWSSSSHRSSTKPDDPWVPLCTRRSRGRCTTE